VPKTLVVGVELRGVGAYVVVPPSIHPSGVPYLGTLSPVAELPPIPESVVAILPAVGATPTPTPASTAGEKIPNGRRNNTLASLAGSMRRRGHTEREILAALLVVNADRCVPPKPEGEIRAVVRSICRYAPAEVGAAAREPSEDAVRDIPASEYLPWLAPTGCHCCGGPLREIGVTGWFCPRCPPRPGAGKKHLGGSIYQLAGLIAGHELPLSD
jgi:Primase C terminal 1 (PriCT-1)/Bifunctional DNA primase/polymerase, N-terminal